jgi:uncharacterized membrane protein YdjX (TVP38/TMEM64 family)
LRPHLKTAAKLTALVAVLAFGLAAANHYGILDARFPERARAFIAPMGIWAPVVFLGLKLLFVVLALPSPGLTVSGGLLFGLYGGFVLNWTGMVAGSCLTFFLGRALGREAIERRLNTRLDDGLTRHGLAYTLAWRLAPVTPDAVVNYGAGLTGMRFRDYLVGTMLGVTPSSLVYTYLGSITATVAPAHFALGVAALAVLAALPIMLRAANRPPGERSAP